MNGIVATETHINIVTANDEAVVTTTEKHNQVIGAMDVIVLYNSEGGSAAVTKVWEAGENISSGRLLEIRSGLVYYHDPNGTKEPYGIAGNAALTGDDVTVTLSGDVTISGWGLTAEAIYYARDNGAINTSPNSTGRSQVIGVAVATDTLNVNIQQSIMY